MRSWQDWKPHTDGFWEKIRPEIRQRLAATLFAFREDVQLSVRPGYNAPMAQQAFEYRTGPWSKAEFNYLSSQAGKKPAKQIAYDLDRSVADLYSVAAANDINLRMRPSDDSKDA